MNVYKAINAVQAELSKAGISKDHRNTQGAGYNFRGIDDVYNAVSPLLAKHGLCILPRMLSRTCDERQSKSGGALFYVTVEAEFDLVCAEDGSKHTIRTFGEAMDSGDKGTNKAMSAAYKYAAFQTFAIPTEGDNDADAHTHAVIPKSFRSSPTMGEMEALTPEEKEYIRDLSDEVLEAFAAGGTADERLAVVQHVEKEGLNDTQKMALWSLLDSKTRTAFKKVQQAAKEAEAA